ncbi:hypothetical protein CYMTET_2493 [Cymbomonas tetramitiformis]|uniref:Uncharacterized protein n=1 Tax=Cymbomonas tetramitiformis TaxID=36881 RepID=A0AAE0H6Y5_9CHLO|nr:hypothetical protein CYMTET_2493 [Cymbomonas tetramitiformis]
MFGRRTHPLLGSTTPGGHFRFETALFNDTSSGMASKFKKQQRQKRYAESGIVFTSAYLDQVERLTASALVSFKAELAGFTKLTSTFKELEKHKVLLTSLLSLADAQCPHEDFLTALDVHWRLLLLSLAASAPADSVSADAAPASVPEHRAGLPRDAAVLHSLHRVCHPGSGPAARGAGVGQLRVLLGGRGVHYQLLPLRVSAAAMHG